jgi:putative sigma-54 modulation protein
MTNLPIHITTHHLSLSDSLRRFLRKKITPLTRFANDTIAAEIGLRRHGGAQTRFSATARLSLPGPDVRGRAVDPDLYAAIGKLVAKLGRLLRKRKTRLARAFKHPGRSEITESEAAAYELRKAEPWLSIRSN